MKIYKYLMMTFFAFLYTQFATAAPPLLSNEQAMQMRVNSRTEFDKHYPYYIEIAAMNQVERIGASKGGSAGHSVVYVKGLCRDMTAPYPRAKVCEKRETPYTPEEEAMGIGYNDISDSNSGLGFSVNKEFQNVNWVAIPGKDLFFFGKIKPNERLTKEYINDLATYVMGLKTHKGIILHPEYRNGTTPSEILRHVILNSMDTDFAQIFGRYVFTVKIPIKESMLPLIVDYVNRLNYYYAVQGHTYNWDGLYNNCAHFTNNLLASIGYVDHLNVGKSKLSLLNPFGIFQNFAVPANRLLDIATTAENGDINDVKKVYDKPIAREILINDQWLSVEPGVLADMLDPVPQSLNDIYKINPPTAIMMVESPTALVDLGNLKEEATHILHDPRYINLEVNREEFIQRYKSYQPLTPVSPELSDFQKQYSAVVRQNLSKMLNK